MIQTIDMRFIRYLNLFEKITKVRTNNCFFYNNCIYFAVPSALVSKAIGEHGRNVRNLLEILRKKIKIVALPKNLGDAERFVSDVVAPNEFKNLEICNDEIIISASMQNKAILIGRNKVRLEELKKIIQEFFGKQLKIV